jgi:CheY-like chemotaxis protein
VAAVEAAARGSYDLIFMDLQMPELDGLEATSSIRKSITDSPVIVGLSASAMEDDRAAMLAAGMDLVIAKPVTKSLLLEAIEEARTVERGTGGRT